MFWSCDLTPVKRKLRRSPFVTFCTLFVLITKELEKHSKFLAERNVTNIDSNINNISSLLLILFQIVSVCFFKIVPGDCNIFCFIFLFNEDYE